MLHGVDIAVCSKINTKQTNRMWADGQFLSFKPVGSRNQWALKS
jgi:hypothetical protein